MLCPALLCLRPPLGPESPGQGQSPASSLGPPRLRKAFSPPRAATPLQTQGKHRGPADPGVAQRAPKPTLSRAGPPATATGRLGAGTDRGQERVPSRGPVPTLLAGLGWGTFLPAAPPPRASLEADSITSTPGERLTSGVGETAEGVQTASPLTRPRTAASLGWASPGLNPLRQRAPSQPPGLMDGR